MNNYSILVIDDQLVNLKILEKILTSVGYDVTLCASGKEALSIVQNKEYHCILLDIVMPEMDGFTVINKLKKIPVVKDIPVIFITGKEEPEDIVQGFELGAVDYITKPFHQRVVQVRVKAQIKLYTIIQSLAHAQAETLRQIHSAQNALLKKPEDIKNGNFSVYYCPLHAAGGDFYDVIEISNSKIAYFVGDFAGHQISTGFLTSSVKALLQQNCSDVISPVESMNIMNGVLCELMKPAQYLTACYAELNRDNNRIKVVNMGHPPLFVIQKNGEVVKVGKNGDILGVFEDALYNEVSIDLLPGDRFILYTDGLIEGDSVWSAYVPELKEILQKNRDYDRDEFIEKILHDSEKLRGSVTDDIMLLVVDIPGEFPYPQVIDESNFSLKFKVKSIERLAKLAVDKIVEWLTSIIDIKDIYGLKVVSYEALSNAIRYGNKSDKDKDVIIELTVASREFSLTFTDSGNGFNSSEYNDPTIPNEEETNGRGFPLIKAYGYNVNFNDRGNEITLSSYY